MGKLAFASVTNLPPMEVGTIYDKPGQPFIFRVIGPDNLVERFTGNRTERKQTLAGWRKAGLAGCTLSARRRAAIMRSRQLQEVAG